MQCTSTIVESQADWLTVTCKGGEREQAFQWWASRVMRREERAGGKQSRFAIRGYTGDRVGRIGWGVRGDGQIAQLSGDLAAVELTRALDVADNCSRIDLAVTVRIEPTDPYVERRHYEERLTAPSGEGRRATSSLVVSDDGGATLYVGKRTSEVMLRVYNKAVESLDPRYKDCHRYELEVKGVRAFKTARQVDMATLPTAFCQNVLHSWCTAHGLFPAFDSDTEQRLVPGLRRRSDLESKLDWLGSAVRPTLDWLREFGHQARMLHALGYNETECVRMLALEEVQVGHGEEQGVEP